MVGTKRGYGIDTPGGLHLRVRVGMSGQCHVFLDVRSMSYHKASLLIQLIFCLYNTRKMQSLQTQGEENDATGHMKQQQKVPSSQVALLLHGPREAYQLVHSYPLPAFTQNNEVLIRTRAIGLNPIDWKAP